MTMAAGMQVMVSHAASHGSKLPHNQYIFPVGESISEGVSTVVGT